MDIAIDNCTAPDPTISLQGANRDRHIIQYAKALTAIGKRMVSSAGQVGTNVCFQCRPGSGNRSANCIERSPHQGLRPGKSQPSNLLLVEHTRAQASHIVLSVNL